jgi:lysozyme
MNLGIAKAAFTDVPGKAQDFSELSVGSIFNDVVLPKANSYDPYLQEEAQDDPFQVMNLQASQRRQEQSLVDYQKLFQQEQQDDAFLMQRSSTAAPSSSQPSSAPVGASAPAGPLAGNLVDLVKGFEGWNPNAYGDFKQTSIGYGTRAKPGEKSISKEEGERRLQQELSKHRSRVLEANKKYGYNFTDAQLDALTSFDYNTGRLEQLTNNGKRDKDTIAKMIPAYNKAGGKPLTGLTRRRAAEMRLFLQGY